MWENYVPENTSGILIQNLELSLSNNKLFELFFIFSVGPMYKQGC